MLRQLVGTRHYYGHTSSNRVFLVVDDRSSLFVSPLLPTNHHDHRPALSLFPTPRRYETFQGASKFVGTGLDKWSTIKVTNLGNTFSGASSMNADVSTWDVSKVKSLAFMFRNAASFAGSLAKWDVVNVKSLRETFNGATKYVGAGLGGWSVAKVSDMTNTFQSAITLAGCNKRLIADAWKSNAAFTDTNYGWQVHHDWLAGSAATCDGTPFDDAMFKQASCKLLNPRTLILQHSTYMLFHKPIPLHLTMLCPIHTRSA